MQQILWVTDDPSVRRVRHLDRVRRAPAHLPRPAGLSPATQGKKMRKDCLRDLSLHPCLHRGFFPSSGKKEHGSRCCTADVCLRQSVNQLYNNQKGAKVVLFSTACFFQATNVAFFDDDQSQIFRLTLRFRSLLFS